MARTKKNVLDSISKAKRKHYKYFRLKSNGTFHHKHTARKSLPTAEFYEVREQLADVREVIRNSAISRDHEKAPEVVYSDFSSHSSTYFKSCSQAHISSPLANVQKSFYAEKEVVVEINSDSEEEQALDSDTKEKNRTTFKVSAELEAYIKKNWKKPVIFLSDVLDDPVYKMSYSPKGLRSSSRNTSPKVSPLTEIISPRSLRAKKSVKIEREADKSGQSENEVKGVESKQEHQASKQGSKLSSSIGLESSKKLVSIIKNLKPSEMTCKRTSSNDKGSPLQERGKSSPNPLQVPDKSKVSISPKLGALKSSPSSNNKDKLLSRNQASHISCRSESQKQVPKITISGVGDYPSLTKFNENDQFRTPFSHHPEGSSEDDTPQLRAQRRIRSPNARYTDNMILFPWDSPRKRDSPRKVLPKPKSPNKSPNSSSVSDSNTDEIGPEIKQKSSGTENESNNSCINANKVSHAVRNLTFDPDSRKEILTGDKTSTDENIPKSECSLMEQVPCSSLEIKDSEKTCCNLGLNTLIAKVSGSIEAVNTVTSLFEVLTPLFGAGLACDSDSESDDEDSDGEESNSDSACDVDRGIQRNDKCQDELGDEFLPDSEKELSGIQRSVNVIDEVQSGDIAKETEENPKNATKLDKRKFADTFSINEEQLSPDDMPERTGESNDLSLAKDIANAISSADGEMDVEPFSLTEADLDLKESECESKKARNIFDLFEMSGSEEKHDSKGIGEVNKTSEKDQLQIHFSPIRSSDICQKSPIKGEKSSDEIQERASKDNSISDSQHFNLDSNSDRESEKYTPSKESDGSSSSAVFRRPVPRKSTKRQTVEPLPMTVLKNVELPDSTKTSAFVSDKLEKYLSAVRGKPLASVKKDPNEPPTLQVSNEPSDDKEHSEGGSENRVFNPRFEKEIMESEPDFDEVNGLLFISFPTKNALNAHLEVESKVQWATSEETMLGVSRINRLKEKAKTLGSSAKITELKMEEDVTGTLREMHKCAEKYRRIFRRELEFILEAKAKTIPHQVKSPTKTSDITKIKGWKNKFTNVEELQSATGLSFTDSGKLHWKTEEKLVKKLDPSNAKKIGLDLKKKRRKYFAFTKRKGMSRGDPKAKASVGVGCEGSGDDSLSSSISSVVAQENMAQENDQEKLPYNVRFFAQHKYDRRKKFVKVMKLSTEEEFILKKLGSQTIAQRTARRDRETGDEQEPELQRDILLFPRLTQSMALAAVSALDNVLLVPGKARRKETKTKDHPVKRKLEEEKAVEGVCMNIPGGMEDIEESTDAYSEQETADGETFEYKLKDLRKDQFDNEVSASGSRTTSTSSKSCGKPGCRYGCICHLCKFNESPDENSQSESPSYSEKNFMVCDKEYCQLGCICDSLEGKVESQKNNYKKVKYMQELKCRPDSEPARNDQPVQNSLGLRQKHTNRQRQYDQASKEVKTVQENKDTLTSGDKDSTTKQEEEKNKDAGKAKNRFSTLPKRESTYRLAKNLDAISRKAWQVYESSEIYVDQRVKRRKSDPLEVNKKDSTKPAEPSESQSQIKFDEEDKHHVVQDIKPENATDQIQSDLIPATGEFEISDDDDEPFSSLVDDVPCSRTMVYVAKRFRETRPVTLSTSVTLSAPVPSTLSAPVPSTLSAPVPSTLSTPIPSTLSTPIPSSTKPRLASSTVTPARPAAAVIEKGKSAAEKLGLTKCYAAMTASEKIGLKSKLPTPPPALSQSKWRTQMVCLKAKKKVASPGEKVQSEIKLLEIISDCKWEEERTNILSKISQIISKQEEITPQSTTYGNYKLEFLPKADKPASIPPELKSKLPESMYSIRIRVTKEDTDEVEIVGISIETEIKKQDLGTEPAQDSQIENSTQARQQRLIQKMKFAERLKTFLQKEEKDGITRQGSFISKESIDKALDKYRSQLHSLTSTNAAVPIITSSSVSAAPSSISSSGISGFKSMNIIHTQCSNEAQPVDKDKTPTVSFDQTIRYCITGNTLRPSGSSILPGVSIAQVISSGQAANQSTIQAQMKLPNGGQSEVYLIPVTGSTSVPTQLVRLVPSTVMTAVGNMTAVVGTSHGESIFTTSKGDVTSSVTAAKSQAQAALATQTKRKKAVSSHVSTESVSLTTSTSTIASLGIVTTSKSSHPANMVPSQVDPDSIDWIGSPKVAWIKPTNTDIAQTSGSQILSGTSFIAVAGKPMDGYGEPRVLSSDLTAKSSTSASTECKTTSTVSQATATRTVMLSPGQQVASLTGGPLVTLASSSGGFTPLRLLQTQGAGPNQKFLQLLPMSGTIGKGTGSGVHPGYIAVPFTLKPSLPLVTAVKPNTSSSVDTASAVTLSSTEHGSHQIPLKTTASGTVMQSFVAVPQNLKGTSFVPVQSLPTSTVQMGKTQAHLLFAKLQPANGPPLLPKCSGKTRKDKAVKEGDEKEKPKKKKKKKKKKSEKEGESSPGDKETTKKKKKKRKKEKRNGDSVTSSDIKEVESIPTKSGEKPALNPLSQSASNTPSISSTGIVVSVKYAPPKSQTMADIGSKESNDVDTLSSSQKSISSLESSCNVSDLISHTDDAGKQIAHALGSLDASSSSSELDLLRSADSKLLSDKEKPCVNFLPEEMKEQGETKSYTEMESSNQEFVPKYLKSSSSGIKDDNDVVQSYSFKDSEVRVVNGSYLIETEQSKEGGRNCILVYEDVSEKQSCLSKNNALGVNCLNANTAKVSDCTLNSNFVQNQEPETGTSKTLPLKRTKVSLLPDDASIVPSKMSRCNSPSLSLADSQFSYGSLSDHSEDPSSQLSLARYLNGDDIISIESSDMESDVDIETVDGHEPTSLLMTTKTDGELTAASSEYMKTVTEQMMNTSKKKRKSQLQPLGTLVLDDLEFKEEGVAKSDHQYKREEKDRQIHRHREKSRRSEMTTCFSELRDILIQDKSLYPCGVPKQLVLSQALHTIKDQEKRAKLLETSCETEKEKQASLKEQLKAITDSFTKNGVPALILKNFLKSVEKCSEASSQSTSPLKSEVIVIPSSNYTQSVTSKGTFLNLGSLASMQTHTDLSGKLSSSQSNAKSQSEVKLGQKSKVIRPRQPRKTAAPEIYIDNPELNSSGNINLLDMTSPNVNLSHSNVEDHTTTGDTERCPTQTSKMFVLASGYLDDERLQKMTVLQEPTKFQTENSTLTGMNFESRDSDDEVRSSTGDLPCETDFPVSQEDLRPESVNLNNGENCTGENSDYVIVKEIDTGETKDVISLQS